MYHPMFQHGTFWCQRNSLTHNPLLRERKKRAERTPVAFVTKDLNSPHYHKRQLAAFSIKDTYSLCLHCPEPMLLCPSGAGDTTVFPLGLEPWHAGNTMHMLESWTLVLPFCVCNLTPKESLMAMISISGAKETRGSPTAFVTRDPRSSCCSCRHLQPSLPTIPSADFC